MTFKSRSVSIVLSPPDNSIFILAIYEGDLMIALTIRQLQQPLASAPSQSQQALFQAACRAGAIGKNRPKLIPMANDVRALQRVDCTR